MHFILSGTYVENTRVNSLETEIRNGDVTGGYTKLFGHMMKLLSSSISDTRFLSDTQQIIRKVSNALGCHTVFLGEYFAILRTVALTSSGVIQKPGHTHNQIFENTSVRISNNSR